MRSIEKKEFTLHLIVFNYFLQWKDQTNTSLTIPFSSFIFNITTNRYFIQVFFILLINQVTNNFHLN